MACGLTSTGAHYVGRSRASCCPEDSGSVTGSKPAISNSRAPSGSCLAWLCHRNVHHEPSSRVLLRGRFIQVRRFRLFLLVKLLLLPIWLPFKVLAELIEHSGHKRHRHRPRTQSSAPRLRPAVPLTPAMRQANRRRTIIAWLVIGASGLLVVGISQLTGSPAPAPSPAKPAAATISDSPTPTSAPSPSPTPAPSRHRRVRHHHQAAHAATHAAPPTATQAPPAPSCYPLSNEGTCYEPGEFCRYSDEGSMGVAGDGEKIRCEDNNGWRWEPI
jgi:hypothetical protein